MHTTSLKRRLAAGELTIGSWVTLGHPSIAEIMVRAGFDWIVIDAEHSVLSTADVQALVRGIEPTATPIVRLTSNNIAQIKRVMDAGAHGVMVPQVNSAAEAQHAINGVYYPPRGLRGVGLARAQDYGAGFDDYRAWLDEHAIVVVMIEHVKAVANIDEIFAVEGIDAFIIGPYDLSGSLGMPGQFDHPDVVALIDHVREAGQRHGIVGGIHVVEPDQQRFANSVESGFRFLGYSMDTRTLDAYFRRDVAALRAQFPNAG